MYYMYWVLKGSIDFYFPTVRLFLPTATPTPHHRRFRMDITPCFWGVLDSIHWWWRGPSPLVRDPMVMVETITAGLETHQCCLNHEKNRLCSTLCVAPHRCPDPRAAAIKSTTTAPRVAPRHCRCRALGPVLLAALLQPSSRLSPAPAEEGKGRVPAAPRRCYTLCSSPQLQAAFPSVHAA